MERRSFLKGLVALVTAPAIIPYHSLMQVKTVELWNDLLLECAMHPSSGYQWVAPVGAELVCSTGRKVYTVGRNGRKLIEAKETGPLRLEVLRRADGRLMFQNVDYINYIAPNGTIWHHTGTKDGLMVPISYAERTEA